MCAAVIIVACLYIFCFFLVIVRWKKWCDELSENNF